MAAQGDGGAILLGKFGAQDLSPIIQPGADDRRTEAIGGWLRLGIRDGQEGIVILMETDALALPLGAIKE